MATQEADALTGAETFQTAIDSFQATAAAMAALGGAGDDVESARTRAHAALSAYWDVVTGGEPIAALPNTPPAANALERWYAQEVAAVAISLPSEHAAFLLSTLYTSMLPEEVRSRFGIFFTPPPLVERLLDLAEEAGVDWTTAKVIDPAAGGGAFLAPIAARMAAALCMNRSSAQILDAIELRLAGAEIDPFSAWMSHVFLELALWDHCCQAGRRISPLIHVGDALALPDGWLGGAELVVGNPPYGRTTPVREVRERFERSLFGHANLYGMFMDLAVRLAKPTGVIAFVTPTGFLGGQYFCKLRRTLREHAPPVAVDFISDRNGVFDGVLQETVLITCRAGGSGDHVDVNFNRPSVTLRECNVENAGMFSLPSETQAPWILPRSHEQIGLLRAIAELPLTLSDYGAQISTGPLVWNRCKEQLRDTPGPDTYPLLWAESVLPNGEFRFGATRRNHAPFFAPTSKQRHLVAQGSCILVQRTTAKEQRRRLIAAVLPVDFIAQHGGAVVENHLNMVRLDGNPRVSLKAIAAVLNSRVADQIFRCINGSVAVSAYELAALPVPSVASMLAVEQGVAEQLPRSELERLIARAYGVT